MEDLDDSYRYLSKIFGTVSLQCSLSEMHGMIIGYLVADKYGCFKTWSELVSDDIPLQSLPEKATDEVKQLFLFSHVQLSAEQQNVDILLPSGSDSFLARLKGLSDFSRGFLYGFGVSDHSHELLSDNDVSDILADLTQFSQVDVHNEDDTTQNIEAFNHIVSYIQEHLIPWKKICTKLIEESKKELLIN